MNPREIAYGLGGLVAGIFLTWLFASQTMNNSSERMMRMMEKNAMMGESMMGESMTNSQGMGHGGSAMSKTMDSMTASLESKRGDEFDKTFIDEMILHHRGAIDMANLALRYAKHQEIRDLATVIIEAQSKEIKQMEDWKAQWYK